jgi:hypothetical protein
MMEKSQQDTGWETEDELYDGLRTGEIKVIAVVTEQKEFDDIVRNEWTMVIIPWDGKVGVLQIQASCDPLLSQAYGSYGPSTRIAYV